MIKKLPIPNITVIRSVEAARVYADIEREREREREMDGRTDVTKPMTFKDFSPDLKFNMVVTINNFTVNFCQKYMRHSSQKT